MGRTQIFCNLTVAALLIAVVAWSTGCSRERPVVIGSKNFTEQLILGEIVAQHLEHRLRIRVDRKFNLGGTLLAHQALVGGDIDLYPEYTGTALTSILKLSPSGDRQQAFQQVKSEYMRRFQIVWLDPLGFNNTFAMVIRGEDARRGQLRTLSHAAHGPGWVLGVGYEFQQRPDGLAGLLKTYGLRLKGSVRTMDLGLIYKALEQRQVDMVAGNATDGSLATMDVTMLQDDKQYFPPYEAAIAVRIASLEARPALREALAELSGKFTDAAMQKLNSQVDGRHRPVREVAQEFLSQAGLR
jgi:glycine betaine/choline ABC-type transport system substrate-binding protein